MAQINQIEAQARQGDEALVQQQIQQGNLTEADAPRAMQYLAQMRQREFALAQREMAIQQRAVSDEGRAMMLSVPIVAQKYGIDPQTAAKIMAKSPDPQTALDLIQDIASERARARGQLKQPLKLDGGVSTGGVQSDKDFLARYARGESSDHVRAKKLLGF